MTVESKVLQLIRLKDDIMRETPLTTNKNFKDETIHIDFNRYQNCDFKDCTIVLEYGICSMSHCEFHSCNFIAKPGSPASFILQMDKMLRESAKHGK